MKRLILLMNACTLPPELGCQTNEMLCLIQDLTTTVSRAITFKALDRAESKLSRIADAYKEVNCMAHNVKKLRERILQKRCELLATQYTTEV